eukprot:1195459-Prorocentrum_minimum.AAC.2
MRSKTCKTCLLRPHLDEGDGAVHVAVAVAEHAAVEGVDVRGGGVLLLHGLERDVLAPLELDQVLQAVHQLEGPCAVTTLRPVT